ncbi:MAG: PH domain-containing protein [Cellvibrionaceae bacterium]
MSPPASEWRRVSPLAIVYFVFDSFRHAINLWPALVPLFAGGEKFRALFWAYGLPGLLALFVVGVVLHFWFFRYKVEADRIHLQRGVLNRKRLTLYFERVQQADIAQPFYFRPFGLATLGLESAGSRQQEVDIPGLVFVDAQALKNLILEQRRQAETDDGETREWNANQPDYELRLPWTEVARYGLMYNGLLLLAPLIAPFSQNLGPSIETWFVALEGTVVQRFVTGLDENTLAWAVALASIFAVLMGLFTLFVLSMLIALVRFWDYHLTRTGDQYQYRAGLGTVKTRGFRLHKLQQVSISQGIVARLLKRYSLMISKAGGGAPTGEVQHGKHFLIPVLTADGLVELKSQLAFPDPSWRRVSPAYIAWRGGVSGTILTLILVPVLLANEVFLLYALLPYSICFLLAWRYWYCFGIYQDSEWLGVKTGFIGSKVVWLPIGKAQKATVSEPPWLKPWRLANLSIWGADGRLEMHYISRTEAESIRDQTLFRVMTFRGRWF